MQIYEAAATRLRDAVPADQLPLPPDDFVRVVHALTEGLVILHALTPEAITPPLIERAFEALAYSAAPST